MIYKIDKKKKELLFHNKNNIILMPYIINSKYINKKKYHITWTVKKNDYKYEKS